MLKCPTFCHDNREKCIILQPINYLLYKNKSKTVKQHILAAAIIPPTLNH